MRTAHRLPRFPQKHNLQLSPRAVHHFAKLLLSLACIFLSTSCLSRGNDPYTWESYSRHLRRAEEALRQEDFKGAIVAYRGHIASRLEVEDRPEWENPHFYNLLIGDMYLKQGLVQEALAEYLLAQEKKVSEGLVSDRIRLVANWLAEQNRFEEAIELLSNYRSQDPVLYDLMRDRLARMYVERDEALNASPPKVSPSPRP